MPKPKSIDEFIVWLNTFSRHSCPNKYYRAWKILILKTDEYRNNNSEFHDLHWAYEEFKKDFDMPREQALEEAGLSDA